MADSRGTFPVICVQPDSDDHIYGSAEASADPYDYPQNHGTHVLANHDTTTEAQQLVSSSYDCLTADCTTTAPTPQCTVKTEADAEDLQVRYDDNVGGDIKQRNTVNRIPHSKEEPGTSVTWIAQPNNEPNAPVTWIAQPNNEPDAPVTWIAQPNNEPNAPVTWIAQPNNEPNAPVTWIAHVKDESVTSVRWEAQSALLDEDDNKDKMLLQTVDCVKQKSEEYNVKTTDDRENNYSDIDQHYNQTSVKTENIELKTELMPQIWIAENKGVERGQESMLVCASTSAMGCDDSGTDQLQQGISMDIDLVNAKRETSSVGIKNDDCDTRISDVRRCTEEHTDAPEQFIEPSTSHEHAGTSNSSSDSRGNKAKTSHHSESSKQSESSRKVAAQKCTVCGKCFQYPCHLERHMRIHTGTQPYQCHLCDKYFTLKGDLTKHIRIHSGTRPYSCPQCDKCFAQSSHLTTHMRIHSGERPYECTDCGKSFAEKNNLTRHTRIHTSEKPYECSVCGKCFVTGGQLTVHTRVHTGEKPYECSLCSKTFLSNTALAIHTRTHTGEKPYVCSVCGKQFAQNNNLRRHQKQHTDMDVLPDDNEEAYDDRKGH